MIYHPKLNEHGKKLVLGKPSTPTSLGAWRNPSEVATVIPDGELPTELNGIDFTTWADAPRTNEGWETLAGHFVIHEPPFVPPKHKKHAAGVIVEESDGRVWLVAPSNAHGGYAATFPKGTGRAGRQQTRHGAQRGL